MDWLPAVMTLVGVLVGLGVQEFRIWRERKDKYKDMVFEKRLDAHQGAYYQCMRVLNLIMPHVLMRDGGASVAIKEAWNTYEWLDKNRLFLDDDSSLKISRFLQYACETASKYKDEEGRKNINVEEEARKLFEIIGDVSVSIRRGIGVEYLPEPKILGDDIEAKKALDKAIEGMKRFVEEEKG